VIKTKITFTNQGQVTAEGQGPVMAEIEKVEVLKENGHKAIEGVSKKGETLMINPTSTSNKQVMNIA
jgi:hypothetical protein